MDLDKIFSTIYLKYKDDLDTTNKYIESRIYEELNNQSKNWDNFSSILYWSVQGDFIGYRSSFEEYYNHIEDDYGFYELKEDLIPILDNPNKVIQRIRNFVKNLKQNTYIPTNNHEEHFKFGNTNKPVNNLKDAEELTNKLGINKMKNVFDKMLETNKNTAVYTAKIQLGKTANKVVLEKIKPQLPMFVKGYADSPLAELVVGNIVAGLLMQFAPNNEKATILATAMIAAGTQVAVESMNIPELVAELLDSVDISGVTDEKE